MKQININILDLIRINKSNKDFIIYDIDNKNKLTAYQLTNTLRYKNKYKHFKVLSCIKTNLTTLTINI